MTRLRPVSARPELVVGQTAPVVDPAGAQLGVVGTPLGRERVVFALPTNGTGPVQLARIDSVQGDGALVADPANTVIGINNATHVHRMVYAAPTWDTRRLG